MTAFRKNRISLPAGLLTGALSLAALAGCANQRLEPSQPRSSHYYLNGQPSSKAVIDRLPAESIARMDVLSGQRARTYARDSAATGVVLVQTK